MRMLDDMTIMANREQVLETLKKNRETHKKIVEEAREGYLKKAEEELKKRLSKVKEGNLVDLFFRLNLPVDQTKVYDTAIKMLEMHVDNEIELSAYQVRNLVMDEWDWKEQFIGTNALYSVTAANIK